MKPLSETLTELGIAFSFPIEIRDANGKPTYYEERNGYWYRIERDAKGNPSYFENSYGGLEKWERDADGNETYYENSGGRKRGTPRPTTNQ